MLLRYTEGEYAELISPKTECRMVMVVVIMMISEVVVVGFYRDLVGWGSISCSLPKRQYILYH